jgi:CRP-like cAMP-binding protein
MESVDTTGRLDRVTTLRRLPLFAELDTRDLSDIAGVTTERAYPPAEPVFVQGEPGDEMLVVISGTARVSWRLEHETVEVATLEPGSVVGELALLTDRPRVADVHAGDRGMVGLVIDANTFEAILCERPQVALRLLSALADRLATSDAARVPPSRND